MSINYDPFNLLDELRSQALSGGRTPSSFPMDAYRRGDEFFVHLDLPGVDPDSIDLTVEKNQLTVRAERRWGFEGREMVARERPQGTFSRQLFLGDSLDADHIDANYEHGVLTLRIPVTEQAKPRKIGISAAEGEKKQINA